MSNSTLKARFLPALPTTAVRYDVAQTLTAAQKLQAQTNMGVDPDSIRTNVALLGGVRQILTGDAAFYVRTDGDDANSGTSNSAGGAFATIQRAVDIASTTLDIGAYTVTIHVGAGTYVGDVSLKKYYGATSAGQVIILGDTTTPSNCVVQAATDFCFQSGDDSPTWWLRGLKLTNTAGGLGYGLWGEGPGILWYDHIEFGDIDGSHVRAANGHLIWHQGGTRIDTASATRHFEAATKGNIVTSGVDFTYVQNPTNFTTANWQAYDQGLINGFGCTFNGSANVTGKRYQADTLALIETFGGGASYVPGDSAGSVATNAVYD